MRKVLLALGASVFAIAAPAIAGDGFYMGLAGIYSDNDPTASHTVAPSAPPGFWFTAANRIAVNAAPVDNLTSEGYGAAVFAGYKTHLFPEVMVAIEADANVFDGESNTTHTQNYTNPPGAFTINQTISQQWISTIRGRVGIDIGPGTVYATGGAAFTDVETTIGLSDTYPNPQRIGTIAGQVQTGRSSEMATGYVWGGGLDLGLGGSTMLRIEYLHHNFGTLNSARRTLLFVPPAPAAPVATPGAEVLSNAVHLENDTFKIGLAWDLNL